MEEELLKLILLEVREFKTDIKVLKEDMTEVKKDVKEVKERLKNVEERLENVEERLKNVEERLENVEELAEFNKETCESIMRVTMQQYNEFKEFANKNNDEHKQYNSKILDYKVEEEDDKY